MENSQIQTLHKYFKVPLKPHPHPHLHLHLHPHPHHPHQQQQQGGGLRRVGVEEGGWWWVWRVVVCSGAGGRRGVPQGTVCVTSRVGVVGGGGAHPLRPRPSLVLRFLRDAMDTEAARDRDFSLPSVSLAMVLENNTYMYTNCIYR